MRVQRIAAAALATIVAGCAVGPRVENFKPAHQPAGIETALRLEDDISLKGELLDVQTPVSSC